MAQTPRENWETQMEREFSPFHRTELKKMGNDLKKFRSRLIPESERMIGAVWATGCPRDSPNSCIYTYTYTHIVTQHLAIQEFTALWEIGSAEGRVA